MDFTWQLLLTIGMASWSFGQFHQGGNQNQDHYQQPQDRYYREPLHSAPPPQILSHKQAQNHDGNFKYAFAAENGLSQGEYIAADGSRNGGYQYVDPSGKKISVKYTAGKEGFRIIEGDHIPRAPAQQAAIPHPGYASNIGQGHQSQQGQYDDGQYRPQQYEGSAQQFIPGASGAQYRAPQPPAYTQPRYTAPVQRAEDDGNQLDEKQPLYNDEPGKAHSFGSGYAFEFAG